MLTKQDLLLQLESELPGTRKMLERVPFDKLAFKPSPRSMSLESLAITVSTMPGWLVGIVNDPSLELTTYKMPPKPANVKELLKNFDDGVAAAKKAFAGLKDSPLNDKWQLTMKGKVLMEATRGATIQQTIHHLVHHRAQLGVYLKMNGVPHPALYGASGDEGW